jgi:hypothetical protein
MGSESHHYTRPKPEYALGQIHRLDADRLPDASEGGAEWCVAIMQQAPAAVEEADLRQKWMEASDYWRPNDSARA